MWIRSPSDAAGVADALPVLNRAAVGAQAADRLLALATRATLALAADDAATARRDALDGLALAKAGRFLSPAQYPAVHPPPSRQTTPNSPDL